jgi:hypothetical protein
VKVADIAIHLLEAIEAGERKLADQELPDTHPAVAGAAANDEATVTPVAGE